MGFAGGEGGFRRGPGGFSGHSAADNRAAEEILNDPANNYVAEFVQDVDRTRVLTAANIMEPP